MKITHLNKEFTTSHYDSALTDERCNELREEFFKKPSKKRVIAEMIAITKGKLKHSNIHKYFFYELLMNTKLYSQKWSPKEFLESNELLRFVSGKLKNNKEFFGTDEISVNTIEAVLRVSPSGTAAKSSNFPLSVVNHILKNYNTNNNYYDYSCGWGVRMLGALASGVNYYGTDPNYELTKKLNEMGELFNNVKESKYEITTQGSEIFIEKYENIMGLIFSSPPYYNLEDYIIGNQSIRNRDYNEWLSDYWENTVINCVKYLTDDGYFLLNIKSFKEYDLLNDMKDICLKHKLIYIESIELKNINRQSTKKFNISTNEQILVFSKKERPIKRLSLDDWD